MVYHKWFDKKEDANEALAIRQEVFCEEQKFHDEFDDRDDHCWHLVLYEETDPIACARAFPEDDDSSVWHLGRIAVKKDLRQRGLGRLLLIVMELKALENGGRKTRLGAQCVATPFYEKCGYHKVGKPFMEEHCEHILMEKDL